MPVARPEGRDEIRGSGRPKMSKIKNVALVHGGFVDGSGWRGVYDVLKGDGFNVSIVQNPTISLAGDVAAARLVIDAQDGPVILVGHSYGGAVITEAGTDSKRCRSRVHHGICAGSRRV